MSSLLSTITNGIRITQPAPGRYIAWKGQTKLCSGTLYEAMAAAYDHMDNHRHIIYWDGSQMTKEQVQAYLNSVKDSDIKDD